MAQDCIQSLWNSNDSHANKQVTILVLEDEDDTRALIAAALRSDGFMVLEANDAEEAVRVLSEHQLEIGVLIIDILLPEMNGDEFAREVLAENPFLKIIFASAISPDEFESRLRDVRYQCFLHKPFSLADLREAVRLTLIQGSTLDDLSWTRFAPLE